MPDKRINRNVNENRVFGKEAYLRGNKFHKRDLRLNKGAESGMGKGKGITAVEGEIRRLRNGGYHCLTLPPGKIILIGA